MASTIPVSVISVYRFSIHKDGVWPEALGAIDLIDDDEARAFATRVIRDMKHGEPGRYSGWTMDITKGDEDRAAGYLLFDNVEIEQ